MSVLEESIKKKLYTRFPGPSKIGHYAAGLKPFDTLLVVMKEFLKTFILNKKSADDNKSMINHPACRELMQSVCLPPDKSPHWKTIFFISHSKHML